MKNRIKVESKDRDGNEIVVYVTRPTRDDNSQAQILASKVFKDAVTNGALVRKTLNDILLKQGIWTNDKQVELDLIDKEINENLVKLKKGGIKLSEARDLAIKVRLARLRRNSVVAERNEHDEYTAEAQSDNAKFDYLVSRCIRKEDGEPYFSDIDDYRENGDHPFAIECAVKLGSMIYGLDENWESDLPENKFLKKYNFVDEELRLVNSEGKYVTTDGKLIDNDFRYIDTDGNYVDFDGNRVDDDGLPVVESQPFLDEDGNPLPE